MFLLPCLLLTLSTSIIAEHDMTQRFLERNATTQTGPPVQLTLLPDEIALRIQRIRPELSEEDPMEIWHELPPLLQRALLYDTGYVLADNLLPTKVYTKCGRSMAEIALSQEDYEKGCNDTLNKLECGDQIRQQNCDGSLLLPFVNCATEAVSSRSHSSMWAGDTNTTQLPEPVLKLHEWENAWIVHSIHFVREPDWGQCGDNVDTLEPVIPCMKYEDADPKDWCRPRQSMKVDAWLKTISIDLVDEQVQPPPTLWAFIMACVGHYWV